MNLYLWLLRNFLSLINNATIFAPCVILLLATTKDTFAYSHSLLSVLWRHQGNKLYRKYTICMKMQWWERFYVAEKRIHSSFNMVMENAKNHSQLNNQDTALGPRDKFENDVCSID